MGMKCKVFSVLFIVFVVFMAANLPRWIISLIPTEEVIMPVIVSHTPTVHCQGTLKAKNIKEKYALQPLMVEETYVKTGDWVEEGDILAKIDIETSLNLSSINRSSSNTTAEQLEYYLGLAKQYGMEGEAEQYLTQYVSKKETDLTPTDDTLEQYIKADASGQLLSFFPQNGRLLEAGNPVYSIATGKVFQAVLQVEEGDIAQLYSGNKVILTGEGMGEEQYSAVITEISPTAVQVFSGLEQKTVVEVIAEFVADNKNIRPGLSLQATIATSAPTTMVSVPYEAILQDENNNEYVYQLIEGQKTRKYIEVEKELSDYVQVSNGLNKTAPVFLKTDASNSPQKYRIVYREDLYE